MRGKKIREEGEEGRRVKRDSEGRDGGEESNISVCD